MNTIRERAAGGREEWLPDVHLSGGGGRRGSDGAQVLQGLLKMIVDFVFLLFG